MGTLGEQVYRYVGRQGMMDVDTDRHWPVWDVRWVVYVCSRKDAGERERESDVSCYLDVHLDRHGLRLVSCSTVACCT